MVETQERGSPELPLPLPYDADHATVTDGFTGMSRTHAGLVLKGVPSTVHLCPSFNWTFLDEDAYAQFAPLVGGGLSEASGVVINMVRAGFTLPPSQKEPLTPSCTLYEHEDDAVRQLPKNFRKVLHTISVSEFRRKHKNQERVRLLNYRNTLEAMVYHGWKGFITKHHDFLEQRTIEELEAEMKEQIDEQIKLILGHYHLQEHSHAGVYLVFHAREYARDLFSAYREATVRGDIPIFVFPVTANVLKVQELDSVSNSYVGTRWCVDSGANRDICRDISMARGQAIPRILTIGEAGTGHSFTSEAIGACTICGKRETTTPSLSDYFCETDS